MWLTTSPQSPSAMDEHESPPRPPGNSRPLFFQQLTPASQHRQQGLVHSIQPAATRSSGNHARQAPQSIMDLHHQLASPGQTQRSRDCERSLLQQVLTLHQEADDLQQQADDRRQQRLSGRTQSPHRETANTQQLQSRLSHQTLDPRQPGEHRRTRMTRSPGTGYKRRRNLSANSTYSVSDDVHSAIQMTGRRSRAVPGDDDGDVVFVSEAKTRRRPHRSSMTKQEYRSLSPQQNSAPRDIRCLPSTLVPVEEDDFIPVIGDDGFAVNESFTSDRPASIQASRYTGDRRSIRTRIPPPRLADASTAMVPLRSTSKRTKKKATTVPAFDVFIWAPGTTGEYLRQPLAALPRELYDQSTSFLNRLFNDDKYHDQACRKLAPENQNKVVNSGVCIAKHIMWKSDFPEARSYDVACQTCCDAADPRPCVRLVKDRSEKHILVFFPLPEDVRDRSASWRDKGFWMT